MHISPDTNTSTSTGVDTAFAAGSGRLRTRWAAIGAAVAVSLGAGGLGLAHAAPVEVDNAVIKLIQPCRLVDTRHDHQVGPRGTQLGENEQYAVTATGAQGECNLPPNAVALSLNVTAVRATAPTYVTISPAGDPPPNASNLNPFPGEAPAPNSVTTGLDAAGRFSIYNRFGQVDIIVDVNAYYIDQHVALTTETYWAVVDADGTLVRGSEGVASSQLLGGVVPTGDYAVVFDADISECAYQATAGRPGVNVGPLPGFAQVANWTSDPTHGVIVFTKDADGAGVENRGFHLLVTC